MRILLLNQHYPPDGGATGRLLADLAEGLATRGHEVIALTGRPTYPTSRGATAPGRERQRDVEIIRVGMAPRRESALGRGLHYLSFAFASTFRAAFLARPDVVLAFSSTPIFGGLAALFLARAKRCPFVYCVQDVHPEIAHALGALRGRAIVTLLRRLETLVWRGANRLVVIGDDLRALAMSRGVADERIVTIHNWADLTRIVPKEGSAFRRELGLDDEHFVVQYAGNLGRAQDLETVVAASEMAHRADDRVKLMLVGAGSARDEIARRTQLGHGVVVADLQPEERVADVLAAADVSLVPLRQGLAQWCVPSKVYSILASGRPVGAVVDAGSEVARVVEEAQCGFCVDPGDVDALAREILRLSNDRGTSRRLGDNGRAWLERNGALRRALDQYEDVLADASTESRLAAGTPT